MALTRITKGVIKPNENYDTHNIVSTGIVTSVGLDVNGNADISGTLSVGGVLTYEDVTSIDSVGLGTFREGIFIPDNKKLELGNAAGSGDIRLYSNSSNGNTYLESYQGSFTLENKTNNTLYINSNFLDIKSQNYGERYIYASVNSSVDLYYDNVLKLNTASSGINVVGTTTTGQLAVTGVSTFQDIDVDGHTNLDNLNIAGVTTTTDDINIPVTNKKLKIGASQQLQLYNQGYHSRIDHVGNHWLSIRSNAVGLFDASDNYFLDGLAASGAVRLYKSNNIKLTTTNTGITVTGTVVSDGADINGDIDVDGHTNLDNVSIAGVCTATSFSGDGSNLTGVVQSDRPAGGSSESEIFFEVDTGVSISTTTTLSRASSNPGRIFTKVKEIAVGTSSPSSVELIVSANEELVVDYFDAIT